MFLKREEEEELKLLQEGEHQQIGTFMVCVPGASEGESARYVQ